MTAGNPTAQFAVAASGGGQPVWFGPPGRPMLGWYFAPQVAQGAARCAGVVLCPPFGHEYLVSYRAYRHLAMRLAAVGFPAFCFDYDGSGDSAGDSGDPVRVPAWQRSISLAMAQLRVSSGCAEVALFGVRLGALLAASVAVSEPCAALVLLAPVATGRAYCRELAAFRSMKGAPPSADPAGGEFDKEVVGYAFTAETQADLTAINLAALAGLKCPQALIVARDNLPGGEARVVEAWRQLGVSVELSAAAGYGAMMPDDAYDAVAPAAIWSEIESWLKQRFATGVVGSTGETQAAACEASVRMVYGDQELRETVISVGALVGVLTEATVPALSQRPTVILTNVGANHRVGNHGLYVTLARDLAAHGFPVVRFDRAGTGDSRVAAGARENDVYAAGGVADVQAVMNLMAAARGSQRFILGGLCSGAYFSYQTAILEPRVVGLLLINILTFQWNEGDSLEVKRRRSVKATSFYLRSSLDPHTWRRMLAGDVNVPLILANLVVRTVRRCWAFSLQAVAKLLRLTPRASKVARNFRALTLRGTEVLMVFGADDAGVDLMQEHLGRDAYLIGNSSRLRLEIIDGVDHTLTPRWSHRYLRDMVSAHFGERFP